jgi:WhiB family transcriptional regulator, redox-sensing transcriptional regulator
LIESILGGDMPMTHLWGILHPAGSTPAALVLPDIIAAARQPWTRQALCAQTDPDVFFSDSVGQIEQAKETCSQCPVREECLSYALQMREEIGVWGGLDRDQRRRLLRRNRIGRPHSTGAARHPNNGGARCRRVIPVHSPVA